MGTLPTARSGIGSTTNSTALQVGGALGVAVIGSVLTSRYQGTMAQRLSGHSVPAAAAHAILGSVGGALAVARIAGGATGAALTLAARRAFVDAMDLALLVRAVVVMASVILVVVALPARRRAYPEAHSSADRSPAESTGDPSQPKQHERGPDVTTLTLAQISNGLFGGDRSEERDKNITHGRSLLTLSHQGR